MNSTEIQKWIAHPEQLNKAEGEALQSALADFPFCGVLHALYLKALKNQNNYLYPKQLKRTAIAVPDRKILYYWAEGSGAIVPEPEKPHLVFKAESILSVTEKAPKKTVEIPPIVVPEKPTIAPAKPIVPPAITESKPAATEVKATKPAAAAADVNLDNLPPNIRETILKARKLNARYGEKFDPKPADAPIEKLEPLAQNKTQPTKAENAESAAESVDIKEVAPNRETEQVAETTKERVEKVPSETAPKNEETAEAEKATKRAVAEKDNAPEDKPHIEVAPTKDESVTEVFFEIDESTSIETIETPIAPPVLKVDPEPPADQALFSDKNETHTQKLRFIDWLDGKGDEGQSIDFELDTTETTTDQPKSPTSNTETVQQLYNEFMAQKGMPEKKAPAKEVETASLGTTPYAPYITETLAQLYVTQKLYNRAINAYEILRLKYPEKSSFFAARISEVKKLIIENK